MIIPCGIAGITVQLEQRNAVALINEIADQLETR